MEEETIVEQKYTTLKSLEKEVNLKFAEIEKKIETIKKAIKSRRV